MWTFSISFTLRSLHFSQCVLGFSAIACLLSSYPWFDNMRHTRIRSNPLSTGLSNYSLFSPQNRLVTVRMEFSENKHNTIGIVRNFSPDSTWKSRNLWYPNDSKQQQLDRQEFIFTWQTIGTDGNQWTGARLAPASGLYRVGPQLFLGMLGASGSKLANASIFYYKLSIVKHCIFSQFMPSGTPSRWKNGQ